MRMKKLLMFLFAMIFASPVIADVVWIDVRNFEEYAQDHIDGDIRISHEEIVPEVLQLFPDKSTEIHLYCRSGRRAGIAMAKLNEAGYTNVSNAGSVEDARKERNLNR
jgi:phage shock protein E